MSNMRVQWLTHGDNVDDLISKVTCHWLKSPCKNPPILFIYKTDKRLLFVTLSVYPNVSQIFLAFFSYSPLQNPQPFLVFPSIFYNILFKFPTKFVHVPLLYLNLPSVTQVFPNFFQIFLIFLIISFIFLNFS